MACLEALFDVMECFGDIFMASRFGWGKSVYLSYTQFGRDGFTVCRFPAAAMVLFLTVAAMPGGIRKNETDSDAMKA